MEKLTNKELEMEQELWSLFLAWQPSLEGDFYNCPESIWLCWRRFLLMPQERI